MLFQVKLCNGTVACTAKQTETWNIRFPLVLSGSLDNRMRWLYHRCQDQRGTRSAHYELIWEIPVKRLPKLRKQLWAGELWNDGYFVRSIGDKVTADIIRKYIEYQTHEDDTTQLRMFDNP